MFRGRGARAEVRDVRGVATVEPTSGSTGATVAAGGWVPLDEVVLESCGTAFTWRDVRDWMAADGSWAACARHAADGRAVTLAGTAGPSGDALRRAAQGFRRERRLIAGEDLIRWLAHWGVSEEEWVDWLDRTLRREASQTPAKEPPEVDDHATWVEAVCSGELEGAALRIARSLGAWGVRTGGAAVPSTPDARFGSLRGALDQLTGQAAEPAELERTITTNAAGWVQVAFEWASFPTVDAAREAVACCREDGTTLAAVAALAGAEFDDATVRAEELEPHLRSVVVSAPLEVPALAGDPDDPGFVVVVRGRRHPSTSEPDDVSLAAETCAEERVQGAMDRWVTWRV